MRAYVFSFPGVNELSVDASLAAVTKLSDADKMLLRGGIVSYFHAEAVP